MHKNNLAEEEKGRINKIMKNRFEKFNKDQILRHFFIIGLFNVIINISCIFLVLPQAISLLREGESILLIILIIISMILFLNILFILIPLKLPLKNAVMIETPTSTPESKEHLILIKDIKREDTTKLKLEEDKKEYLSEEDLELEIPAIPIAPKKKEKLTLDAPNLSNDVLERIKLVKSPNTKVVLVNCDRCEAIIPVPIPKNYVLSSELPVVPVSFIHKNLQNIDIHCITIHLDHDFDIRRQRISDVILSSD